MTELTFQERRERNRRRERIITVIALVGLVLAWIVGYVTTNASAGAFVDEVLPGTVRVEEQGGIFTAYDADDTLLGYAATGRAGGYAGPVEVLVGVNPAGATTGVVVIQQRETPNFYREVENTDYLSEFTGVGVERRFVVGDDIDGMSGATLTAEAIARGVRQATRDIASARLDQPAPPVREPIRFGWPEFTLLALFGAGFVGHRTKDKKLQKTIRWVSLICGIVFIGFVFNKPLTISHWTSFLAGYWPNWQTNLYWYLLLGGVVLVTVLDRKNPYCTWFCPFGALQETIGTASGAKVFRPRKLHNALLWAQRGMAYTAVVLGLAFRQPASTSYEPFGALFGLRGTWSQFALLALVLLASIVIMRPFCNYLCPLDPTIDLINYIRRWVKKQWVNRRKTASPR